MMFTATASALGKLSDRTNMDVILALMNVQEKDFERKQKSQTNSYDAIIEITIPPTTTNDGH